MTLRPLTIAYLYTTFPKSTETFMQREIIAMRARGVNLRIYSLIGGGGRFEGIPVTRFSLWRLLELIWVIPKVAITRWDVFGVILKGLLTRRPPSWLNFWENMLGAGFAGLWYPEFRQSPPDLIHAAWGGAPATAAWMLHKFNGHPYSAAAHAYDLYEHGGDWWLYEKLVEARFIHTSTQMGADTLAGLGLPRERIHVIRRGLDVFPPMKPLRRNRSRLRIVAVARLVAKKGLRHQLRIYAAARAAGVDFEARIVGDGPLRNELESLSRELGLESTVTFLGHRDQADVWAEFDRADVLIHTGIVAPSGDRDGLPNVIPEAMTAGTLVVTSPVAATREAIRDGETGLIAAVEEPAAWVEAFRRLASDDGLAERLQGAARTWVESEYDAHRNAARLHDLLQEAARP